LIESDFDPKAHKPATFRPGSRLRTANSTKITVQDVIKTSIGTVANNPQQQSTFEGSPKSPIVKKGRY